MLKTLKLLLDLRSMWKSKTLSLARLLTLLPVFDLTFFQGESGTRIVELFVQLVNYIPGFMVTTSQGATFLVVVLGFIVAELRKRTTVPVEHKA